METTAIALYELEMTTKFTYVRFSIEVAEIVKLLVCSQLIGYFR